MKKIILVLILIAALAAFLTGCTAKDNYNNELVVNGNFEEEYTNWTKQNGASAIFNMVTTNEGSDQYNESYGEKQLELNSGYYENWLYLTQEIEVVKGGIYKLQVDVNVSELITNESLSAASVGAYVGFAEDSGIKRVNVINATDGWQTLIVYFTPVSNTSLNIQVGLGTSTSTAKGSARLDNVSVVRLESVIGGNVIYDVGSGVSVTRANVAGTLYVVLLSILSAIICFLAYMLIRIFMAKYPSINAGILPEKSKFSFDDFVKSPLFLLTSIMIVAFIIRLLIVNSIYGHLIDVTTFNNWAMRLAEYGPTTFYQNISTTYPPGYLYVLWLFGAVAKGLGLSGDGLAIFLKIPSIVSDIIIVYILFAICSKHFNMYIASVIASLYAILPIIFTNSAAWGQMDSLYTLFVLLTFVAILDKKYISVIVYFSIAIFIRAEVLVLLPIVLSYLTLVFIKNSKERTKLAIAVSSAIVGMFLLSLPFTVKMDGASVVFYVLGRYAAAAVANPLFSSNAFNFYGIFGLNMESVTSFARVLSWLIYFILAFYVSFIYFYKRNRAELLLLAGFLVSAVYVFSTAMTSQSMYMAFALLIAYIAISGEKRVLLAVSVLALTNFLNLGQLLNQSGYIGHGANTLLINYADNSPFMIICGIINVAAIIYLAIVTFDVCYSDDVREIEPMPKGYFKTT